MDQKEFESHLEYRICREFSGMSERRLRALWCDGVILGAFALDDPEPRILGGAWICNGSEQEEWRLELLLSRPFKSRDEIHWEELLPADGLTKWMSVDLQRKHIQIEPAAAVPDLE
jgi:hypothetical protein